MHKKSIMILIAIVIISFSNAVFAFNPTVGYVTANNLNVRCEPNTGSNIITQMPYGTPINITELLGDWYKVPLSSGGNGYVFSQYVSLIPVEQKSKADEIIETAKTFLGTRYSYGSCGPYSFDCSGFTSYVMKQHGIILDRSSREQANNGYAIETENLQAGDLVFFSSSSTSGVAHVGIYISDGNFIHASSGQGCVVISNLSDTYYSKHYKFARRVL